MFPGLGGMDPRKMKSMMQQLGIKTEELNAKRAIFELEGKKLVVDSPQITVMTVQGQKTYTVVGEAKEEKGSVEIPDSDIQMVAQQAKVSQEEAKKALDDTKGDIAEAISRLEK